MIKRSLSSLANLRLQIKLLIAIVGMAVLAPASWFIYTLYHRSAEAEAQNVQLLGALESSYEAMAVIGELSLEINNANAQISLVQERELSQIRIERSLVNRLLVVVPKIRDYQPFDDDTESQAMLDTLDTQIQLLNESYLEGNKLEATGVILQSARLTLDQYRLILRELDTKQLALHKTELSTTLTVFLPLTIGFMIFGGAVALGLFRNLSGVLEKDYDLRASLSERERWFQALFERSPIAVGVSRDGTNLHVNDAYLKLFGLTEREDVIGGSVLDHIAPEYRDEIRDRIASFPPGREDYENIEIRALMPDGTSFPYMATVGRITLPDGPAFIGYFTDITELKLSQSALADSEQRLALMFRSTSDMLMLFRVEPSGSLTIDALNDAYKESISKWLPNANMDILGRDRDKVLLEWGYNQDEIELERELYVQAISGRTSSRTEVIAKTPSGDLTIEVSVEPIVDTDGNCTHVLWNGRDITKNKLESKKLEESQKRLELVFQSTSDLVILYKVLPDGMMVFDAINEPFKQITLQRRPGTDIDVIGKERSSVLKSWGFNEASVDEEQLLYQRVSKEHFVHRDESIIMIDDRETVLDSSVAPVLDAAGHCTHILWSARDITERTRAEIALRDSEERYALIEQAVNDGVWDWNVVTDHNYISPRWKEILGYADDELANHIDTFDNLIHPDDRENEKEVLRRHFEEHKRYEIELRMLHKDNEYRWILCRGEAIRDENGKPVRMVGSISDVTARLKSEELVRESKDRLSEAQRIAKVGSWELDLTTNELIWSDEIYSIFEIDKELFEPSYEAFLDAIHPEEREIVNKAYADSLESREPYEIVHRLQMPDGTIKFVEEKCESIFDEEDKPVRSIGTVQDITVIKQQEEDLRLLNESLEQRVQERTQEIHESEERFRSLSEASPVGIQFVTQEGVTEFANEAWNEILGIDWRDRPELGWSTVLHPDDKQRIYDGWIEFVNSDKKIRQSEARIIHPEKGLRWVSAFVSKIKRSDGFGGYAVVLVDVTEERVASENLTQSEDRFRVLSDNSPVGIFRSRADGYVLYVNEKCAEILGRSIEECIGWGWKDTHHPDDAERVAEQSARSIERNATLDIEHRIIQKDGTIRWIRGMSTPMLEDDVLKWHIGTIEDITNRKETEMAIRENDERFRALSEAAPVGIQFVSEDGIIEYANDTWNDILGINWQDNKETGWMSVIHPDDVEIISEDWHEFVDSDRTLKRSDTRIIHPERGLRYLTAYVSKFKRGDELGGYAAAIIDVTEEKTALDSLSESEERFRSMTEASPAGIAITRVDGENLYFNDAYLKMMGLTAEQANDVSLTPPFHPDDAKEMKRGWQEFVDGDFEKYSQEARILTPDGGLMWIKCHAAPMRVAGKTVAFAGIFIDNTEMRLTQSELQIAKETAEQANSAKDKFLSRVSHEFRTPLNAILGFAQVMGMDEQNEDNTESIRQIIDAGQHLLSLVDEVLDIAQIESGDLHLDLQTVDVLKHLEECSRLLSPLTDEKDITISISKGSGTQCNVIADPKRLNQVLINVLSNAIKYNRQAGKVGISVSTNSENQTVIEISDTGAGIHPDKLTRVFAPFDRLGAESTDVSGTGIGLSLSSSLMEAMGGEIAIKSEVSKGTTVSLVLPTSGSASPESVVVDNGGKILDIADVEKRLKVHLVEDNTSNYKLMQTIFSRRGGSELILSENAADALSKAKQDPPDLFLLDVNLPDSTGTELLIKIRAVPRLRNIPVIVVSADANLSMIDAFEQMGVLAYLTKPVDIALLLSTIKSVELGYKEVR